MQERDKWGECGGRAKAVNFQKAPRFSDLPTSNPMPLAAFLRTVKINEFFLVFPPVNCTITFLWISTRGARNGARDERNSTLGEAYSPSFPSVSSA